MVRHATVDHLRYLYHRVHVCASQFVAVFKIKDVTKHSRIVIIGIKRNCHWPKSFSTRLVIGLLIFFVILSFLFWQHSELDECLSNPCLNGVCLDRPGLYACECDDGYIGPHCDIEVNECHSHPFCGNGTCVDDWLSYTCSCNYGFTGSDCSISLSDGGRCTKRHCFHDYIVFNILQYFGSFIYEYNRSPQSRLIIFSLFSSSCWNTTLTTLNFSR